jgi:hypothetical protein
MTLLEQQGPTCFITSVAMVLDISVEDVRSAIGHDNAPHYQEFYPLFREHGLNPSYQVVTANVPCLTPNDDTVRIIQFDLECLKDQFAILFTQSHALAWDGRSVYDPRGFICNLSNYTIVDYILLT